MPSDRILLSDWRSVEWQSLTFLGERHEIRLRVSGPDSRAAASRLVDGISEAEFAIAGQIVADIAIVGEPAIAADGATDVHLEALTVAE